MTSPAPPTTFRYDKPAAQQTAKAIVGPCQTDIIRGAVQVIKQDVAFDRDVGNRRVDVEPPKFHTGKARRFDGRTG